MEKKVITFAVIILLVICLVGVEHYYGDNIYGWFVYKEYDVKQIDDTTFYVAKDRPVEAFTEFMESQGYKFSEQLGAGIIYENDVHSKTFDITYKEFYAELKLTSTFETE